MKRKLIPFILLVSTIFVMASCFGDDDTEVTFSNETGITAFSLGTQKIVKDTVGKSGKDSTYQTTIDCSKYIFYIDQINHEIYNPDSLPVGIDSAKIICEATSKSSATILVKSMTSDTLKVFSSSDSISFYKPRTFRVLSLSGLATVDYTVKVNIHREKPNVFKWQLANNSAAIADLTAMRALALNGRVYVMGRDTDSPRIYVADEGNTVQWHEVTPNIDLGTDFYKNIAVMGGRFYTYAKDGAVYTSADAETWTRVAEVSLSRILGASDKMLYALGADRSLMASTDGATWQQQDMDTPADSLPTDNYSIMVRKLLTNQKINRVVLTGTAAYISQIWSRIEETDSHSEPQPWTYMDVAGDNRFGLPNMENLQVVNYGDFMLALGGRGMGNSHEEAFSGLYASTDGGLTWRINKLYNLPEGFSSESGKFAFTRDSHNYLWVIASNGDVWRGRLNRLGWKTDDTYFGE